MRFRRVACGVAVGLGALSCFGAGRGVATPPECPAGAEPVETAVVYRAGDIEGYHWECRPPCSTGRVRLLVRESGDLDRSIFERHDRETRALEYACVDECPPGSIPAPQRVTDARGELTTYPCVPTTGAEAQEHRHED